MDDRMDKTATAMENAGEAEKVAEDVQEVENWKIQADAFKTEGGLRRCKD